MNRLKETRQEKNLTQKDVSVGTGIPTNTYSNYERGDREPKLETWQKLADYFGVPVGYLMGVDDEDKQIDIHGVDWLTIDNEEAKVLSEKFINQRRIQKGIDIAKTYNGGGEGFTKEDPQKIGTAIENYMLTRSDTFLNDDKSKMNLFDELIEKICKLTKTLYIGMDDDFDKEVFMSRKRDVDEVIKNVIQIIDKKTKELGNEYKEKQNS